MVGQAIIGKLIKIHEICKRFVRKNQSKIDNVQILEVNVRIRLVVKLTFVHLCNL